MKMLVLNPSSKATKNIVRDVLYGCWCKGRRIGGATVPPHALLSVASYLKRDGYDVDFIDAAHEFKMPDDIKSTIHKYELLIASTSSMSFKEDANFFQSLKEENKRLKTIIFGSHPTFLPKETLSQDGIDIIIKGEPEYIVSKVISHLSNSDDGWRGLKGVGFKSDSGKVTVNAGNEFIQNLDQLPYIDISLMARKLNYFNPIVKRTPYMTMITSRGCPGKCTFCTAPFFYGTKMRFQSPLRVVDEIRYLVDNGFKEIYFRDETFTADYKRLEDICHSIMANKIDVSWLCNARSDTVDKPLARLMKKAGCHMVKIGAESGVQEILDKSHKGITVEQTREAINWLKEEGIDVHTHLMLGMPGDTTETIEKTIKFICEVNPYTATFGICTPYPGTPLFYAVKEELRKRGRDINLEDELNLRQLHTSAFYNEVFTNLNKEELECAVRRAYRRFYLQSKSFIKYLKDVQTIKRRIKAAVEVIFFMFKGDQI